MNEPATPNGPQPTADSPRPPDVMAPRPIRWLRSLARRPKLWPVAAIALVACLYLAWAGAAALWVRSERSKVEQALAEYDLDEARRRLARCIELRPRDRDLRLLASR